MKLATYVRQGQARAGLVHHDRMIDWHDAVHALLRERGLANDLWAVRELVGEGVLGFVERAGDARPLADQILARAGEGKLAAGTRFMALAECELLAPIPRPRSMRDGYAFRQHVETARRNRGLEMIPEFDEFPVFYFTNHDAVVGPGPLRVGGRRLERLDFELEAAIVVGKTARNLTAANADDAIFGLTIMNDWSARALQMDEMKLSLGPAKGKDFATGLGPVLVTLDELAPHAKKTDRGLVFDLGMRAWVNDVLLSQGNVSQMTWTFAQILERVSDGVNVNPGDVIGSGTCGTGCFLELNGSKVTQNQWLQPGDRVVLEIDGIGRLDNHIELDPRS